MKDVPIPSSGVKVARATISCPLAIQCIMLKHESLPPERRATTFILGGRTMMGGTIAIRCVEFAKD